MKPTTHHDKSTSELLTDIINNIEGDTASLGRFVEGFNERGFSIILLMLGIMTIFTPPGLTLLIGIFPMFFAVQMVLGQNKPWLPEFFKNKRLQKSTFQKVIDRASKYIIKLEEKTKVRLTSILTKQGERIIGAISVICAASIMIPLPFTNFAPGLGIAIMGLGLLLRDGLITIIGAVLGLVGSYIGFEILFSVIGWVS